jgi:hypothetical protein
MSRLWVAVVFVALSSLWLAGAWWAYRRTGQPSAHHPGSEDRLTTARETLADPLSSWSEPPTLVFLFSGQQKGRLKPCGCAPQFQKGGLARRASFFQQVRQRNWPTVTLDLGGLVDDPRQIYGFAQYIAGPEHRLAKLQITVQALKEMQYDALGLGPEDINLEAGLLTYSSVIADVAGPVALCANISVPPDLQEQVRAYHRLERAGVTVGVTALVGKTHGSLIHDPQTQLAWVEPSEVLPGLLQALEGCQLKVLLFYGEESEARQIATSYAGAFDLVIHGDDADEPPGREAWVGETLLVTVGSKGKYAGAVGYWPRQQLRRLRFELVSLDNRFRDHPSVWRLVYRDYLDQLESLQLVERMVKKPLAAGQTIAGVEQCRACHPRTVKKWEQSHHALGLESLKKTGEHVNPECLACHTTRFGYVGGYGSTPQTAHLGGNQCENCHGPAGQHVADPENVRFRQALHLDLVSAEAQLCRRCHDAENDPEWDFSRRWPEVDHRQEARADALEYRRTKR